MPTRRHPQVVNVDEVEPMERSKGRFGATGKRLGAPAGPDPTTKPNGMWVRKLIKDQESVDYFAGEETGEL